MPFVFKRLALVLSIAAACAADKETPFKVQPAASYPAHQTAGQITIGVDPYTHADELKLAFGKLDPNDHGVLPVLVVIENGRIRAAGPRAQVTIPANAVRVDGTGKVVIPGLIDAHCHYAAPLEDVKKYLSS